MQLKRRCDILRLVIRMKNELLIEDVISLLDEIILEYNYQLFLKNNDFKFPNK